MIKNQWYGILPSKSVEKGSIVGVKRLNLELVLYRDEKGELGCVVDQCSHRGAALSKGKMEGNCIRCPFHGLEFDTEGKCKFIPAEGKASTADLTRYNVKTYPVRELQDIIYFWYGDEDKITEDIPFFHNHIDSSFVYSELEDHWNTHYSRAIENQLDVVHVPIVHHNTIGRGNKTLVNGPKVVLKNDILQTSADNEVDVGQKPRSSENSKIKSTNLNFKYPNIWLNNISDKIKALIYFAPVDDENTILYIRFYNKITGIAPIDKFIAFFGKFANKIVERQDKVVVVTQKPKASELKSGEKLLRGDKPIIEYRKIREQLKQASED